jgi:hypothetical protein
MEHDMDDDIFYPKEAASFLRSLGCPRVTVASLATGRSRGGYPQYNTFGRYIYYTRRTLLEWASKRTSNLLDSTSTPVQILTHKRPDTVFDAGDLIDYCDPDFYFDDMTKALSDQQDAFDYRKSLE